MSFLGQRRPVDPGPARTRVLALVAVARPVGPAAARLAADVLGWNHARLLALW